MREPGGEVPQPQQEANRRVNPLEITQEAAEGGLRSIAENPVRAYSQESAFIAADQPEMNAGLTQKAGSIVVPGEQARDQYIRGALTAHRIIRTQAEMQGVSLPQVSRDVVATHVRDQLDELSPEDTLDDAKRKVEDRLRANAPKLADAIAELTKYETSKGNAFLGAADVHSYLKKQQDVNDLQKQFDQ